MAAPVASIEYENAGPGPVAITPRVDYLAMIFRRCVAAIIGASGVSIRESTLQYVVLLAELRMQDLFSSLAAIMRIQRRSLPALEDIALFLTEHNINVFELLECQRLEHPLRDELDRLQFTFEFEEPSAEAQAFFDNRLENNHTLAPTTGKPPSYAPSWAPPLPPVHTYRNTASYSNSVMDLRSLRARLVEEGVLAERALQRLSGERGAESAIDLSAIVDTAALNYHSSAETKNSGPGTSSSERNYIEIVGSDTKEGEAGPTGATDDLRLSSNLADQQTGISAAAAAAAVAHDKAFGEHSDVQPPSQAQAPKVRLKLVSKSDDAKPLSLKISLQPPKTGPQAGQNATSKRPRVDIVELASLRAKQTARRAGPEAGDAALGDPGLEPLFKRAMQNLVR